MEALETGAGAQERLVSRLAGEVRVAATLAEPVSSLRSAPDARQFDDRQLDAILERLDRLCDEVHALNRRLDSGEQLAPLVREVAVLNESLQTLAYAALGQQAPRVHRRRAG